MKAIILKNQEARLAELEIPNISDDEVLVKTRAFGLNRIDLLQIEGKYKTVSEQKSQIMGLEFSGEIHKLGKNVNNLKKGDRVFALVKEAAFAEYVKAHHKMIFKIPSNLNFVESAGLLESLYTVYLNLIENARLKSGEKCLIHAGASGVGVMAIQMAKLLKSVVIATCSSEIKSNFCKNLGADLVINYQKEDFHQVIKDKYNKIDVVLDMFGGDFFSKNISLLNEYGRISLIGLLKDNKANINLGYLLMKNITIIGSTLRSKSLEFKIMLTEKIKNEFYHYIENGSIKPIIDKTFDFEDFSKAFEYMKLNQNIGKIILDKNI